jgi:hypothetical protein
MLDQQLCDLSVMDHLGVGMAMIRIIDRSQPMKWRLPALVGHVRVRTGFE